MSLTYAQFLANRAQHCAESGFTPTDLPDHLFPFQHHLTDWAVRTGRAAVFADCGLGKTVVELAWAEQVYRHTGKPVLVLTPLAVAAQIEREAHRFGHDAAVSRDGALPAPVTITNYEQAEKVDPGELGGVVCDESSAIKAFDGQRRVIVTELARTVPYRLLATATAAPNDYIELGTSSEALGHLGHIDMLNRFFVNANRTVDTRGRWKGHGAPRQWENQQWRFKGHAKTPFWRWVASWARAARAPSDLGFDDDGFDLPPLSYRQHLVTPTRVRDEDALFDLPAQGLRDWRMEARNSVVERCELAAGLLADTTAGIAWCHLNAESSLLARLIPDAVEVTGTDPIDEREAKLTAFTNREARVLVIKPVIGAWGLNWQHCHRMTYFPSYSYEQMYQAVRRCWRFGQQNPVIVDVVTTPGGVNALTSLQRKGEQAATMFAALVAHMRDALRVEHTRSFPTPVEVPAWAMS